MVVWLMMMLSTLGFARSYMIANLGGRFAKDCRSSHHALFSRARSSGPRSNNPVVGQGAGEVDQGLETGEWDTWEFGSWKASSS